MLTAAASVIVVVAVIVAAALDDPGDGGPGGGSGTAIPCDPGEHFDYHVHAHLTIRADGAERPVPANIGIRATCITWLHTHATDGIIHVEAPTVRDFTLGQFFDVWGQPLSTDQVGPIEVGEGSQLFAFVDGQPYEGDPRGIQLADTRTIELQIGTEPLDPLPYSFPPEYA